LHRNYFIIVILVQLIFIISIPYTFAQLTSFDYDSNVKEQNDLISVCELVSYCSNPVYFGSISNEESNRTIDIRNSSLANSNLSSQSVINNTDIIQEDDIADPIENVTWITHYNEKLGISIDLPSYWIYEEKTNRFNYTLSDLRIDQTFNPFERYMGMFITIDKGNPDLSHIYEIAKSSLDSIFTGYDSKFDWYLIEGVNTTKYDIDGRQAASYIIQRVDKNTQEWGTGIESIFVKYNEFTPIKILFFTDAQFFDDPYSKAMREYMVNSIRWMPIDSANASNQKINESVSKSSEISNTTHTGLIQTSLGPIGFELFSDKAPNHVKNFEALSKAGFYDGIVFHRIVPGFVIQAGDPNTKYDIASRDTWGTGGPGYTINEEFNDIPHERGILSMARTNDPNSAGSQFFIVLNDSRFLDNQYTVFGKITNGMDIVDKIANLTTNSLDQPINPEQARIKTITINE
jgi:cyclophilin family peptidyl-prolyl cis-trans isomerase